MSKHRDLIVAACDQMLSLAGGLLTADHAAEKFIPIGPQWMCMFSGDDVSPVFPIRDRIQKKIDHGDVDFNSVASVADAISKSYSEELAITKQRSVLAQYGLTLRGFHKNPPPPKLTDHLIDEMGKITLGVSFLVFGYANRLPHIFTVENPGTVSNHDIEGYQAIGSGGWAANSSLMLGRGDVLHPQQVIYEVLSAKFAAESAGGVGKATYLLSQSQDGYRRLMYNEVIDRARSIWDSKRIVLTPTLPELEAIKDMIDGMSKDENRL